ncbi:MAG TPA: HAD-IA family hydrolase [bacterium]|nr:HAD-IA family hydrolase [bacterium]HPN45798.1 HAD-IA family hydrolase [bacterium]
MLEVSPKVAGLIFDCDGTLADTMPIHWQAWRTAFTMFSSDCPLEFLRELSGIPSETIVQIFNERFNRSLDPQVVAKAKNDIVKEKLHNAQPVIPIVNIVKAYYGKIPMAVASGGTRTNVINTLKAIGLESFFQVIITADDKIKPKPDPEIFLEIARRINVKPELCQVFEDGDAGIRAVQLAGMIVTDVRPFI